MRFQAVSWLVGGCLCLAGCGGADNDIEQDLNIDRGDGGSFIARFNPSSEGDGPELPFPISLAFKDTEDYTLNITTSDPLDYSDPIVALNALDGFSTMAPISAELGAAIDDTTLTSNTVRLFEVTLSSVFAGGVTSITAELVYGSDFIASVSGENTIVISPLKPLKPRTAYMVALTTGIQATNGRSLMADSAYGITKSLTPLHVDGVSQVKVLTDDQAVALEPLRPITNSQEAALNGVSLSSEMVALSWTFATQSVGDVLSTVHTEATGTSAINPTTIGTAQQLTEVSIDPGNASIYVGSLNLPYYLTNGTVPTDPLSKYWEAAGVPSKHLTWMNFTPIATSTETVPLLVSVPNKHTMPVNGWPVVIFQHGITSDRTAMLAIAETLASTGFAVVAIDMPLHGLPTTSPLYSGIERTFDLDLANNETSAPGPDGTVDSSGTHYINLSNLLVTRDNVRQSIADLFALHEALATMDYDGGGADFDTSNIYFVGHSLGAMVGVPFLALEPNVKDAVLGMPGGGIAKLLDGSAEFGPVIAAGLGAAGVAKGSADYESFMGAAQTVLDAADPNNYAIAAVANRGVLMFEVTGDTVIPNNVYADAPEGTTPSLLAGTDPLRTLMGLTQLSASYTDTAEQDVYVRFKAGMETNHRSLLDPQYNALATSVMQKAMAGFLASSGFAVVIDDGVGNDAVVEEVSAE